VERGLERLDGGGVKADHVIDADDMANDGHRWWFLCPLARKDGGPPRRAAKLYLPPGRRYFGSRQAYGLTYQSCQESGKFNGLYRRLAANMGTDEALIRRALKRL
jgi:hypothetical protein